MKGLPPKLLPLRVVVLGDAQLLHALSDADNLILSPVETNLEISARVSQADVIVVDVAADPAPRLEAIKNLQFERPVLALVGANQAAEAIAACAAGAIAVKNPPDAISAAIGALYEGLAVADVGVFTSLSAVEAPEQRAPTGGRDNLTRREHEVLVLLAEGLSNKEIAAKLGISEHTAKFHVNSILQKMGAQKRVEAVVRAARAGLIEL